MEQQVVVEIPDQSICPFMTRAGSVNEQDRVILCNEKCRFYRLTEKNCIIISIFKMLEEIKNKK